MADEFNYSGRLGHTSSGVLYQVNRILEDQTGVGSAAGEPTSTTTPTAFDLTDITIPGMAWFRNLGTNDVTISILVSAADKNVLIVKAAAFALLYMHGDVISTNALQHNTSSGTSVLQWQIWEA